MAINYKKLIEIARAEFDPYCQTRCQVWSFGLIKNRIIGIAKNDVRTHTLNLRNPLSSNQSVNQSKGSCAELKLFIQLKNKMNLNYKKLTIINIRLTRNMEIGISCPCNSCKSLLRYFQPKEVIYTNNNGGWEKYKI